MSRIAVYKKSGMKFENPEKSRAQRIDEQNGIRRIARQAKNDAKRGLAEIYPNVSNLNETVISDFILPPIVNQKILHKFARSNRKVFEVTSSDSTKPTSSRVTRSQTKNKAVNIQEFQDSSNFQSTESFSASQTPQRNSSVADNAGIQISPLVYNNPWICTTRGSSSKKQHKERLNQEAQSSPLLKKRSLSQRKTAIELPLMQSALNCTALNSAEKLESGVTDVPTNAEESTEFPPGPGTSIPRRSTRHQASRGL